jgi:hypothetical protein
MYNASVRKQKTSKSFQNMKNNWLSETLRLTAFVTEQADMAQWWKMVTGDEPDNRLSQPKAGILHEEGSYKEGHLVLDVQPKRVDWVFIPAFEKHTASPFAEELKPYESAKAVFLQIAKAWFKNAPEISRIAFGAMLDIQVPDRINGYQVLAKYLHKVQIDVEESIDLFYQINRRRNSKNIPGLALNRLSKWGVAQVEIGQASGQSREIVLKKTERFFARVELDINTLPEYRETIPQEKLSVIFDELVSLADEIAEKGDIP